MLVAAVLSALVPEDAVSDLLGGSSGVWAFALAAAVGIPLYVCEGEEVPLTVVCSRPALDPARRSPSCSAPSAPASPRCSWHAASSASARPFYLAFWIAFAISVGATYQALMG